MNARIPKDKTSRLIPILVLVIILGMLSSLFFFKKDQNAQKKWEGIWEISYYYENEPGLEYTGTLKLNFEDSLKGEFEIFAPKSIRSELIDITNLSIKEGGARISGEMEHTSYKINEGFLKETFEFVLEKPDEFRGQGQCSAFCAEGTEGFNIVWEGKRPI